MAFTVREDSVFEFTEKKSVFTGRAFFTPDEESAKAAIRFVESENETATHNVFAYKLRQNGISRASDAGEPQGTAGAPVLKVIDLNGLTDVCIVVTRYFGGILLGAGGLVRAYTRAAAGAVEMAGKAEIVQVSSFSLTFGYDLNNSVSRILDRHGAVVSDRVFTDSVTVTGSLYSDVFAAMKDELDRTFYTNIIIRETGICYSRR